MFKKLLDFSDTSLVTVDSSVGAAMHRTSS